MREQIKRVTRTAAIAGLTGLVAGYKSSPTTTEHYLHKHLSHNTYSFDSKAVKFASWLAFRSTGLSPTPWAVKHRVHHSPFDSQDPKSRLKAVGVAIRSVITTTAEAERTVADPEKLRHITYGGTVADPLIDTKGDSPKLMFQNKFDKWLSSHPVLERAMPVATIAVLSAAGKVGLKRGLTESIAGSTALVAGFAATTYLPGLVAAYPERKDGYSTPTEAGRDLPDRYQMIFGHYALHSAHHLAPHLSDPPGVIPQNRDLKASQFMAAHGLGHSHDGQALASR
jgi:hypothetical protein